MARLIERLLDGFQAAAHEAFAAVERACRAYDARAGANSLTEIIEGWGADLALLRGSSAGRDE